MQQCPWKQLIDGLIGGKRRGAGMRVHASRASGGGQRSWMARRGLVLVAFTLSAALMMGSPIAARVSSANASPTLTQGSTSPVEDLISQCPSSSEVASFNADLAISFEGDPTAGKLVCHATDGSADLTRFQERVYQALRVMKALRFSKS